MINAITFIPDTFTPEHFKTISLYEAIEAIKNGHYAAKLAKFKEGLIEKNRLPSFSFGGIYKKSVKNEELAQYSNLFHFDIDKLDDVATSKKELMKIPGLVFCFVSPSGNGLKGALHIKDGLIANDKDFKAFYPWLESYLLGFGFTIDKSCKDIRRLCFVSVDADIYFNPNAAILEPVRVEQPQKKPPPHNNNTNTNDYPKIAAALFTISPDVDYNDWLAISMALKSEGEQYHSLWLAWSQSGQKWKENDAKKWDRLNPDSIGIGTLFHHAKQSGWKATATQPHTKPMDNTTTEPPEDEAQEWRSDLSSDIDFMIPENFGIASDIQRWILDTSVKRQPAIALAATLSILSVVLGRQLNFNGIKGNIMTICLAGSGHGKDHPLKCAEIILSAIGLGDNVYAQVASGAALFEAVQATPSCLLQIDEMGHYLSSINSKSANPFLKEVMPMITRFYTDANTSFSDKGRKGAAKGEKIIEPNLSLIGMTTENQIIEAMRTSEVSDGSLARFLIMYGEKATKIQTSRLSVRDVPDRITLALKALISKHGRDDFGFVGSKAIKVSEGYQEAFNTLSIRMNDYANELGADENGSNAIFEPFYHRIAVRSAQIALVIDQCQDKAVLKWAEELTIKTTEMFTKKFKHLAADNENERMAKIVERAIKESGKAGISRSQLYDRTRKVSTIQKKMILDDLMDSGKVFTSEKRINNSRKVTIFYFWRK